MGYVWKERLTIAIGMIAALIFGIGVFTVINKFVNLHVSFAIGVLGFVTALVHLDGHFLQRERLEQKMQEELERDAMAHEEWQEYQRQQER